MALEIEEKRVWKKNIFGMVYDRKYLNQRKEINTSLSIHESNPSQVQESSGNSQTVLNKISQPYSNSPNESFNDLNVPIAVHKGNNLVLIIQCPDLCPIKIFHHLFLLSLLNFLV